MGIRNIRLPRDPNTSGGKEGADHLPKIEGEPNSSTTYRDMLKLKSAKRQEH